MKNRDKEILKLLQEGKSYSDIQVALSVSPSTIIGVKKKFLNTKIITQEIKQAPLSSTIDKLHSTTPTTKTITQETKQEPLSSMIDTLHSTTPTTKIITQETKQEPLSSTIDTQHSTINDVLKKQIVEEKTEIYSKRRHGLHKYPDIEVLSSDTEKIKSLISEGYEKKETIADSISTALEKQIAGEKIEIYSKGNRGLHKYLDVEVLSSDAVKIKSLISDGYEKREKIITNYPILKNLVFLFLKFFIRKVV